MSIYEITFIFDKDQKELPKKLEKYIKDSGGKVQKKDDWGVKSLAYPIKKHEEAHFLYFEVEMDTEMVKTLERKIQLDEELLRYLVVKA